MNQQNLFVNILGCLTARPARQPTSKEAFLESAMAERLHVHANDGLSLFVLATTCGTDNKLYLYPISAQHLGSAIEIAVTLHVSRGLPPAEAWTLIFEYPDPSDRHLRA